MQPLLDFHGSNGAQPKMTPSWFDIALKEKAMRYGLRCSRWIGCTLKLQGCPLCNDRLKQRFFSAMNILVQILKKLPNL